MQFPENAKTSFKTIFFISSSKGMMINIRRTIHCGIHGKSANTGLSRGRHLSPVTKTRKRRVPRQRRRVIRCVLSGRKRKLTSVNVNTRRVRFHFLSTNLSLLVIRRKAEQEYRLKQRLEEEHKLRLNLEKRIEELEAKQTSTGIVEP